MPTVTRRASKGALASHAHPPPDARPSFDPPLPELEHGASAPFDALNRTHDARWSPEGVWEARELPEGTHGRVVDPALLYAKER